jgi:hypothetical protein
MRALRVEAGDEREALAGAGYASAFAVSIPDDDPRTPEQWARSAFEGAPLVARSFVVFGWRHVMGFRLGPHPSPTHMLGWDVISSLPEFCVLEVHSPRATARKVVRLDGGRVVMATFVRFETRTGSVIWATIAPVHHRTEPYLLGRAARHPSIGAATG